MISWSIGGIQNQRTMKNRNASSYGSAQSCRLGYISILLIVGYIIYISVAKGKGVSSRSGFFILRLENLRDQAAIKSMMLFAKSTICNQTFALLAAKASQLTFILHRKRRDHTMCIMTVKERRPLLQIIHTKSSTATIHYLKMLVVCITGAFIFLVIVELSAFCTILLSSSTNKLRGDSPQTITTPMSISFHHKLPSPFEETWSNYTLPEYMKKDRYFVVEAIPNDKKTCLVHVGKTAGSTVGCALGFNLHCPINKITAPGLFPQYTTNMMHSQINDCQEDSAYFVFVVRNPLDRMISAFNYDNPENEWKKWGDDWEGFLLDYGENDYNLRKKLYIDCPFATLDELAQQGLSHHGNATEECRRRAVASIVGTEHFGCHFFFNYQYHLEALPEEATIMTIRTEHLIKDWNSVEYTLGGEREVLGPDQTVLAHNNVNTASDHVSTHLSNESRALICEKLCNEIQIYKKILRNSVNLSEEDVQNSIYEMVQRCPREARAETCAEPLPDITDKLVNLDLYF